MDASIWLWMIVAAAMFWLVGLYNRLMRLRSRALEVLSALERQVRSCVVLLATYDAPGATLNPAGTVPSEEVSAEWIALAKAAQVVEAIWGASRKNSLSVGAQQKRAESWAALQQAWEVLVATPPDLAGAPVPDVMRTEWEHHRQKAKAVQDALNTIVEGYDDAVREYPARWVAGLMGFEPSAKI